MKTIEAKPRCTFYYKGQMTNMVKVNEDTDPNSWETITITKLNELTRNNRNLDKNYIIKLGTI